MTGLTFQRSTIKVYHNGDQVEAVSQREALLNFIEFLNVKIHLFWLGIMFLCLISQFL